MDGTRAQQETTARTARVAGHFGEFLQGRIGNDVALVTLPCQALAMQAHVAPGALSVAGHSAVSDARARVLLEALGTVPRGRFSVSGPLPPGGGAGASTAGLVALARAAGCDARPDALAQACLAAEGAVDPVMLARPGAVLWAPRRATVLRRLPVPPPFAVLGGFWGPGEATDPNDTDFPDISDLVGAWATAAGRRDRATLARLASVSAERTTALRGPKGDPTADLARSLGALGHVRAHTGSARALLFAPGGVPDGAAETLLAAGFRDIVRFTGPRA